MFVRKYPFTNNSHISQSEEHLGSRGRETALKTWNARGESGPDSVVQRKPLRGRAQPRAAGCAGAGDARWHDSSAGDIYHVRLPSCGAGSSVSIYNEFLSVHVARQASLAEDDGDVLVGHHARTHVTGELGNLV